MFFRYILFIFTAEVTAIDLAVDTIAESDDDHFIIFSDSISVLLSLHSKKMDNPLILQLLQKLHHLSCAHKTIHLCWIPSHIGIRGNEAADMAAKESLDQDITASQVPYTDFCTACQIYSVRHVLIDCIDLGLIRPRFYSVPDMKTLFDTVSVDRIISFVKEINLFSKI